MDNSGILVVNNICTKTYNNNSKPPLIQVNFCTHKASFICVVSTKFYENLWPRFRGIVKFAHGSHELQLPAWITRTCHWRHSWCLVYGWHFFADTVCGSTSVINIILASRKSRQTRASGGVYLTNETHVLSVEVGFEKNCIAQRRSRNDSVHTGGIFRSRNDGSKISGFSTTFRFAVLRVNSTWIIVNYHQLGQHNNSVLPPEATRSGRHMFYLLNSSSAIWFQTGYTNKI